MKFITNGTYKKYFFILLAVFVCMFTAEFISLLLGKPIIEIYISGIDLERDLLSVKLLRAFISASFVAGLFNFYIMIKLFKQSRGKDRLPAPAIVVMTLFFPVEMMISGFIVIPSMIFLGIKGFVVGRKKISEEAVGSISYDERVDVQDAD